jgi:hypothetical protein
MSIPWRDYQQKAAELFRRLGLAATVERRLEGARGAHTVYVYVEGALHCIPFKWVVECKSWKASVPKEKVMALAAIVQDLGVDRGILLSETGFQSGAVRAAHKTNIMLSSLEDLSSATEESVIDTAIGRLNWRIQKVRSRLYEIKRTRYHDEYFPPMTMELGRLFVLEAALDDAMKNEYPTVYAVQGENRPQAKSLDELIEVAEEIIAQAEQWKPPSDC